MNRDETARLKHRRESFQIRDAGVPSPVDVTPDQHLAVVYPYLPKTTVATTLAKTCRSSEPFGQVSNRFRRRSGPSELKLWLQPDDAAGVAARWF